MGKTQVAVCLAPTPLNIDGKPTVLDDGKSLSLPDGIEIWRTGNVYFVKDLSGNSVRAEVNATWINATVGLGRWPTEVHGLLANANGNVNELESRDGTVLKIPIPFEELYQKYGDSWRVPPEDSLVSVCGDGKIESGNPAGPFYANDLPKDVSEKARAICTAAGVKEGPLLDACTLDVAVIGNETAANVYVGMSAPVVVATPPR
jgi:hypothetical protein